LKFAHQAVTGSGVRVDVFVVNPPVPSNLNPVSGIAAAYALDAGLIAHSAVAAALRVTDSSVMADVLDEARSGNYYNPWIPSSNPAGTRSEAVFDPYLWTATPGQGDFAAVPVPTEAQRNAMFPRRVHTAAGSK